ncbi:uncharacterized protein LOC114889001 isoform X1 [Monodon monoceros]|uniref:uncharacterized protein LOC114889001 isoform X1 n=1 Tax=Monodon monoceros TaxID=40151 RepID=UPI0010F81EE1|nr:uncharacterized protein LOC114889001 isoform X1 [Monodon monoceros]
MEWEQHEGRAAGQRQERGADVDAGRRGAGRQHGGAEAVAYEGQDENPEMRRVLPTHEITCRNEVTANKPEANGRNYQTAGPQLPGCLMPTVTVLK